jgi:uncharacterized protein YaiL (DUF2058 family)
LSLRDQLLAKGLVSKKQAAKAKRDLKRSRKNSQGHQKKKRVVAEEEKEAARHESAVKEAARLVAAQARKRAEAEMQRAIALRKIVLGQRIGVRGPLRFHHRPLLGTAVVRQQVSEAAARALRAGAMGIVAMRGREVEYFVLARAAVQEVLKLAPALVVFFQPDGDGADDTEFAFTERTWDADLRARRSELQLGDEQPLEGPDRVASL